MLSRCNSVTSISCFLLHCLSPRFQNTTNLLSNWKQFVQFSANERDSFFNGGHVVYGRGRRRTGLSSRHFMAVHVSLMCYATWPVTVGQSTVCLAWERRTISQWATIMFRNHIHSAANKYNSSKYQPSNSSNNSPINKGFIYTCCNKIMCQCPPVPQGRQFNQAVIRNHVIIKTLLQ